MEKKIAECIRQLAQDLGALADAILLPADSATTEATTEATAEATTETVAKDEAEATKQEDPITHEQLREFLGNLATKGHTDEIVALLQKYGTGKLSSVKEESYGSLYAEAQKLAEVEHA